MDKSGVSTERRASIREDIERATVSTPKTPPGIEFSVKVIERPSVETGPKHSTTPYQSSSLLPNISPKRHVLRHEALVTQARCKFVYNGGDSFGGNILPNLKSVSSSTQLNIRGQAFKPNQKCAYTQWAQLLNLRRRHTTLHKGKTSQRWNKQYIQDPPKPKQSAYLWNYSVLPEVTKKQPIIDFHNTSHVYRSRRSSAKGLTMDDTYWQIQVSALRSDFEIQKVTDVCEQWVHQCTDSGHSSWSD